MNNYFNTFKNRVYRLNKKLRKEDAKYWYLPQRANGSIKVLWINANTGKAFKSIEFDTYYIQKTNIQEVLWHIQNTHK